MAWHSKRFIFTATSAEMRVNHDIGQVPDVIIVTKHSITQSEGIAVAGGYSSRLYQLCENTATDDNFGLSTYAVTIHASTGQYFTFSVYNNAGIEDSTSSQKTAGAVHDCNDTSFYIGNSTYTYTSLTVDATYDVVCLWNDGAIDGSYTPETRLYSPKRRGGYQILDLNNHDFNLGDSYQINGVYKLLQETRKVIMVSGLRINGIEFDSSMVSFSLIDFKFIARFNAYYIIIDENDNVTITETPIQQTIFINEEDDL